VGIKAIFMDPEKCTGCKLCELACSLKKTMKFNPIKSMISVMQVTKLEIYIPIVCLQCRKPFCEDVCPTRAMSRDEKTGAMVVNRDLCVGCRMCMIVCPFEGVSLDTEAGVSVKCDLCGGDPVCVKHCAYGAIKFVTVDEEVAAKRKEAIDRLSKLLETVV